MVRHFPYQGSISGQHFFSGTESILWTGFSIQRKYIRAALSSGTGVLYGRGFSVQRKYIRAALSSGTGSIIWTGIFNTEEVYQGSSFFRHRKYSGIFNTEEAWSAFFWHTKYSVDGYFQYRESNFSNLFSTE